MNMPPPAHLREIAELATRLQTRDITVHDVEWHGGAWFVIVAKGGEHLEVSWDDDDVETLSISRLLRGRGTAVEYWDKPELITVRGGRADSRSLVQRTEEEIVARLPDA